MSIEKLDEFIERQGIKSAELCKIIDRIEQQLKTKDEQIKELEEEVIGSIEAMNILASSVRKKDQQIESHRKMLKWVHDSSKYITYSGKVSEMQYPDYVFKNLQHELSKEFK